MYPSWSRPNVRRQTAYGMVASMAGVDFVIIKGREKATINAETLSARRWLYKHFAVDASNSSFVIVSAEEIDSLEKLIQGSGFLVTVR